MSFEEQKQKIKDILENVAFGNLEEYCPDHVSVEIQHDIESVIELIEQFTPPKPPTCQSCNKLTNCKISNVVFAMHNAIDFGCNHHSDYKKKE